MACRNLTANVSVAFNEKILNSAFDNIIGKGVKIGYINKIELVRPYLDSSIEAGKESS